MQSPKPTAPGRLTPALVVTIAAIAAVVASGVTILLTHTLARPAAAAAGDVSGTPRSGVAPAQPSTPSTRPSLADAMRLAESQLPNDVLVGVPANRAADAAIAAKDYRLLLAAGEPIVTSVPSMRRLTVEFSARLPADLREQWLRNCLHVVDEPDPMVFIALAGIRHSIGDLPGILYPSMPRMSIEEAVFNLSQDGALKSKANALWTADETTYYNEALTDYGKVMSSGNRGDIRRPQLKSLPVWGEKVTEEEWGQQ